MILLNKFLPVMVFFVVIIILFFGNVIFGGKTLLSYGPNMYPEKYSNRSVGIQPVQDNIAPSWIDVPYSFLVNSSLKNFKLPLWNRFSGIGYPLAADMESSAFFPLHLPSFFGLKYWDLYLILRLFVAFAFLYLFLKEIGLRTISSLIGGFLYSFTGYFIYYINNFGLNVDMLLPAGLFLGTRFLKNPTRFNWLLIIMIFFLILNGGNPQPAILGILLIDSYLIFRIFTSNKKKVNWLFNILFINALSLGLSSFNYLIFLELYKNSWTIHPPGLALKHMDLIALSNFVFPYLIGYLRGDTFNNILSTRIVPYFGVVATWLALNSLASRKHRNLVSFFFIFSLIWILKLIGLSIFDPFLKLPIVTNIWFNKYTATLFLSMSILSSIGAETICDYFEKKAPKGKIRLFELTYPLLISLLMLLLLYYIAKFIRLDKGIGPVIPWPTDESILRALSDWKISGNLFLGWEKLLVFLLTILAILVIFLRLIKKRFKLSPVFLVLIMVIVVSEVYYYYPKMRQVRFDPAQKFPYVDFLKNDRSKFRIYGTKQTSMPQQNLFYSIDDIRIVSPLLYNRYADFFRQLLINQPSRYYNPYLGSRDTTMNSVNNKLLSLLNVKYVLSNNYFPEGDYKLVYDRELKIYLNKNYLPRSFLVNRVITASDKKKIFSYMKSADFSPLKEALVENLPEKFALRLNNSAINDSSSTIIRNYQSDRVEIEVLAASDKFLVLSDLYYPGWEVYIDGKKGNIYPTNYIMRGVFVNKGRHLVQFFYRPGSFRIGVKISLTTLLAILIIYRYKLIKFKDDKENN